MINIIVSPYQIEDIERLKKVGATTMVVGTTFYSVGSVTYFSMDELQKVHQKCRQAQVQLYVLLNRFFLEDELLGLREHLAQLKKLDVDGIYFSDLAVFYEAKQMDMQNKLIYNPDTLLTNHKDIQAYLDLGIHMCTIAKEITLTDILHIADTVCGEIELIVHGRLKMMHSKRKLLSNYFAFIKKDVVLKNKHTFYLQEEHRDEHMPIVEEDSGTHIFSGFCLASFEEMQDFLEHGIQNFRIEALFSNLEEQCQIVQDYKDVIDKKCDGREIYKKYEAHEKQQNITKGFLFKKTGAKK
ncbi:MAG: peptidase U32 family protein [Breznakia sp.]